MIPVWQESSHFFLGLMGDIDPTHCINTETNRIPFRQTNPNLAKWSSTFRSWPSSMKKWRTWYKRMSASKQSHWEEMGVAQCLALSLADLKKDEPMPSVASYFWSDTFNSFLFNHGPMTPTFLDNMMLTGLDITTFINPFTLDIKCTYKLKTKHVGGWSGFVTEHMGTGPITDRERIAFLAMWLERNIFCGSTCVPTSNFQHFAQALVEQKKKYF